MNSGDSYLFSPLLFESAKNEAIRLIKQNSFPRFAKVVTDNVKLSWTRIISTYKIQTVSNMFYQELFKIKPK
eukprot:Pgem_evm1s9957